MSRYLIVANQTLGGEQLDREIKQRIGAGPSEFYVVVPMTAPQHESDTWIPADAGFGMPAVPDRDPEAQQEAVEEARKRSEHRLNRVVGQIQEAGGQADGQVGLPDPAAAVQSVLDREDFDEIIVSTLPTTLSRWLKMDLPSKVARMTDAPVVTVIADE